jgi:hypothetical protein
VNVSLGAIALELLLDTETLDEEDCFTELEEALTELLDCATLDEDCLEELLLELIDELLCDTELEEDCVIELLLGVWISVHLAVRFKLSETAVVKSYASLASLVNHPRKR